jgi:excisionase family DNA binding protein
MADRLLLRVEEVAEMLSLGRSKTYELIASGVLPAIRLGRCVRVPADALHRWLETQYDSETSPPARSRDSFGVPTRGS